MKKKIHLSEEIYKHVKQLFSGSTNSLIPSATLLANVYASNIRIELNKFGQKKRNGLS